MAIGALWLLINIFLSHGNATNVSLIDNLFRYATSKGQPTILTHLRQ